jgi:PAS domain S-box-containing protein
VIGSVLLLAPDGVHVRHGAAPSLPPDYVRAVDGAPIGPRAGSCGTAMFRREQVVVQDIATDGLWADYKGLALQHGLRACWSTPILDAHGKVLGSFAFYFRTPREPVARDHELISLATHVASIAIVRDQAEASRHEALEALREREERLRLAIDAAHMGTFDWDLASDRIVWRTRGDRTWDARPAEFTGPFESFASTILPEDRPAMVGELDRCKREHRTYGHEFRVAWRDGSVHWLSIRGEFEWDAAGVPSRMRGVMAEITRRKRAEEEIRRLHEDLEIHARGLERRVEERTAELVVARDRAEAADRTKSAFLASMSHELRTPLNSIIGFTGILLQRLPGPLTPEQDKQLQIVRNASRHLLALINDVLDISKVEAGELHVGREAFDLRALLDKVAGVFSVESERRGLTFALDLEPGGAVACGDPRRVEQVLNNLLGNALKFTPTGGIRLACRREGEHLAVAVIDTGLGIAPADLDKLFRPFSQIETGLAAKPEGTGLGLAITKRLVEAMGGTVRVESAPGQGSTFGFTLPAGGDG